MKTGEEKTKNGFVSSVGVRVRASKAGWSCALRLRCSRSGSVKSTILSRDPPRGAVGSLGAGLEVHFAREESQKKRHAR